MTLILADEDDAGYQRNQIKISIIPVINLSPSQTAYRFPTAHGIHGYLTPRPTIGIARPLLQVSLTPKAETQEDHL
jgi:hypothetical protein